MSFYAKMIKDNCPVFLKKKMDRRQRDIGCINWFSRMAEPRDGNDIFVDFHLPIRGSL